MRVWGARGTSPAPGPHTVRYGGHTSCIEVRSVDGTRLVLDAGSGLRALGASLEADTNASVAIMVTHRHIDHVMGLPQFAPLLVGTRTVHVWCADDDPSPLAPFIRGLLAPPLLPAIETAGSTLAVHNWPDGGVVDWGAFHVRRFAARHPGTAGILRIDDAHGPLVAFAPDNELGAPPTRDASTRAWYQDLVHFLRDVPLLLHDATFTTSEATAYVGWGHSSASEAAELAAECGAERLLLFHHHPDRWDDEVERMAIAVGAEAAAEGETYAIPAMSAAASTVVSSSRYRSSAPAFTLP